MGRLHYRQEHEQGEHKHGRQKEEGDGQPLGPQLTTRPRQGSDCTHRVLIYQEVERAGVGRPARLFA